MHLQMCLISHIIRTIKHIREDFSEAIADVLMYSTNMCALKKMLGWQAVEFCKVNLHL